MVPTIRLRKTAGTPSECRSLMSRPDNAARKRRRFRFLTAIWVSRPLAPAKWILAIFFK